MDKWQELSYQHMTEESGGESADEITCHPLPWRSDGEYKCKCVCVHITIPYRCHFTYNFTAATKFIKKLDNRHKKDILKRGSSNLQAKNRVLGSPSQLPRVPGPEWAVVHEPAAVANQQPASTRRKMERDGHHTSSSDSDSDFNIADLI